MRPITLTMQAFGSYGDKVIIDFTKPNQNLFLVTGNTGSGKSTIFDAIVFALYGKASSGENKKDGAELQSQYADLDKEPFVELTFSELRNGTEEIYTVHRVPRHFRKAKRTLKNGSGVKDESESVDLILPDGSEFPSKKAETNEKIEEIVGLTKEQFMQVAMIAQGEFMELLRADSNKKKDIFRKLFHTEVFQKIVDELKRMRGEKSGDIDQVQTVYKTEAAHAVIPEDYPQGDEILARKERILRDKSVNIQDMEMFLTELEGITKVLEEEKNLLSGKVDTASRDRDQKRDRLKEAKHILDAYSQLEEAEAALKECEAAGETLKKNEKLIGKIRAAYEVKTAFDRYYDADKTQAETREKLKAEEAKLPKFRLDAQTATGAEDTARKELDRENESFAKVSERVEKALDVLKKIGKAGDDLKKQEALAKEAEKKDEAAKTAMEDYAKQEQAWRTEADSLSEIAARRERHDAKTEQWKRLFAQKGEVKALSDALAIQKAESEKAKKAYADARDAYIVKNEEYLTKQTAFLDAQAGFLAKEKLKPGKPCPVCGSLDHPHPCELKEGREELTREVLDALTKELNALQNDQTEKSTASGSAEKLLEEKAEQERKAREQFRLDVISFVSAPMDTSFEEAVMLHAKMRQDLIDEHKELEEKGKRLSKLQELLNKAEAEKEQLKKDAELSAEKRLQTHADFVKAEEILKGLADQKDYPDEMAARDALNQAKATRTQKEQSFNQAHTSADRMRRQLESTEALVTRYQAELPQMEKDTAERKAAYESVLKDKYMAEAEWKELCESHPQNEADLLQRQVDAGKAKETAARAAKDTAKKVIGEHEKPVLEELEKAHTEAEGILQQAQKELETIQEAYKEDHKVYTTLAPKMKERSQMAEEYTRVDGLYKRLSGNVSGARMDLETFVQRYYLERILIAANERFRHMSAGQYELRMMDEEAAGSGKNKGLDLMIYSTVTGKEREIRTLSGGESFMAALSLALGMADQISESSTVINLDMMFIDEGFGSLDDHSRNQAVRVLQEMAGGSKLIGIISHVTELKQEIDDQLQVTKDEEGSHVRWVIS